MMPGEDERNIRREKEIRLADDAYRRKVKLAAVMGLVLLAALYAVGRELLPSVERWIVAVPGQEAERARL